MLIMMFMKLQFHIIFQGQAEGSSFCLPHQTAVLMDITKQKLKIGHVQMQVHTDVIEHKNIFLCANDV